VGRPEGRTKSGTFVRVCWKVYGHWVELKVKFDKF
jgi:hypothetical protein